MKMIDIRELSKTPRIIKGRPSGISIGCAQSTTKPEENPYEQH
jgi:hypothetical protein